MRLLLIRHGQMAGDPYVCPARPVSGCLSPEGVAQAGALRDALAAERIDAALSSPYGRALQTAEIALTGRGVPITIVPGIEEWKPAVELRSATSTVFEALQARDLERYAEETWKTEQGEGAFDMYARVVPAALAALAGLGWHHRMGGWVPETGTEGRTVAVFAHGGSLSVLLAFLLGVAPFPVGRFSFALTGVAQLSFVERRGLHYPTLALPTLSRKGLT
jgi:broad specificity phosphatase PhoE